jgi:hypothetical protein
MKSSAYVRVVLSFCLLAGCAGPSGTGASIPSGGLPSSELGRAAVAPAELANLDYSDGSISVYAVVNGRAQLTKKFTPGGGRAQGLAVDKAGVIYTTITSPNSRPCTACVEAFTPDGKLTKRLKAPILQGAPGAPSLTDVSVDRDENVYVSDYGQQAVYFWADGGRTGPTDGGGSAPTIIVQNSQNAASVLSTPNGADVLVSGGCGFASVRPYRRVQGHYQGGSCFGIGTIALIGASADDLVEVLTPVDGVPALVSVSSPTGGATFHTPDRIASISGVALNSDASVAYVANAHKEVVYAFARPAKGWLSGGQPKLIATYKGFANLDIIAVRP